jgi:DNA-binding transcriptional MerR regulator
VDELTIDELAARAGSKTSTIRLYQHQGLLPGPEIRGRVGYYGAGHVARLELVKRLQDRGYTLSAIKDLVDSWESGRDLKSLLGLEEAMAGEQAVPEHLSYGELAAYFAGAELDGESMRRAVDLGLIALEDDGVRVPNIRFLEIGSELVRAGFSPGEVLDEWERVERAAQEITERFRAAFERHVWEPFVADGMPADRLDAVTATLRRMQELGVEIVVLALRDAITEATESALATEAARLTDPP